MTDIIHFTRKNLVLIQDAGTKLFIDNAPKSNTFIADCWVSATITHLKYNGVDMQIELTIKDIADINKHAINLLQNDFDDTINRAAKIWIKSIFAILKTKGYNIDVKFVTTATIDMKGKIKYE
jgi:hypothetical protein